ncbi:hypothetical protein SEUCBS139899_009305 [Sporothrix eucalyptigena]|uniref:PBP domain-containing protein n=1 Tax=Sporothrix eucalyptigena TaxID=1812306 RepID=A0ABP0CR07_9PEZI
MSTSLISHGNVQKSPSATYGAEKTTILRVGNGGAGATGLLQVLAAEFLATETPSTSRNGASIDWVCNHSRNTQLALFHGFIDVALTYERDMEAVAAAEGWSTTVGCIFHDHFVFVGHLSDPANVKSATSLYNAFQRIHRRRALFHSRQDGSATMVKENSIWSDAGLPLPADNLTTEGEWYKTSLSTPEDALKDATAAGAYLLTDRSTLLRQTWLQTVPSNVTVFFEPTSPDDILMNSCYALKSTKPKAQYTQGMQDFLHYLASPAGQATIANYGVRETGLALFSPAKDGFATIFLRGGRPQGGRWVFPSKL